MRKVLVTAVLATLGFFASGAVDSGRTSSAASVDWQRFRVVSDHFSVLLPALPAIIKRGQYGRPPTGIPPFGLPTRKDARTYAAYSDGVVYQVIAFENPNPKERLEFFYEEQLSKHELLNVLPTTRSETSKNNLRVFDYKLRKYDYQKTSFYPGVLQLIEAKNRAFALLVIGKDESDPAVSRFLQSFEAADQPNGLDVGKGADSVGESDDSREPAVSPKEASRKPMIVIKPLPSYTPEARQKRLGGEVKLRAVLNASGRVTNIETVSGLPDFFRSSTEAAQKICFIPALKDGRFVSTTVELVYNFNIY